mmetsp:Transcript_20338/g.28027  ORF Transcript_20338/g.28027 Transcript_20338/m.28027 type:complete len:179 (+) Transcript_20338:65-601(+)
MEMILIATRQTRVSNVTAWFQPTETIANAIDPMTVDSATPLQIHTAQSHAPTVTVIITSEIAPARNADIVARDSNLYANASHTGASATPKTSLLTLTRRNPTTVAVEDITQTHPVEANAPETTIETEERLERVKGHPAVMATANITTSSTQSAENRVMLSQSKASHPQDHNIHIRNID